MSPPAAKVLLVDDRPENLLALEAVLAPLDCELVSVSSGQAALKRLLVDDFALIVLDVQMPGLDGFETADYIKRREKTSAIPIIFVTAISKEAHHVFRGYSSGAVDYLLKPYDPGVLRSKVAVFLDLHAKSQALRDSEEILRATFQCAPIGMARLDVAGRVLEVNDPLCRLLRRSRAELVAGSLARITHPEDVGLDAGARRDLLAGDRARYEIEKRMVRGDGVSVPVLLSVAVARLPRSVGQPESETVLLVQAQDLSDRRRAEQEREGRVREQTARAAAEESALRLAHVQRVADSALTQPRLDAFLPEFAGLLLDMLSVDSVAVVALDPAGQEDLHAVAGAGMAPAVDRVGIRDGLAEQLSGRTEPLVVDDISRHPEWGEHLLGDAVVSLLALPMRVDGRCIGSVQVGTILPRSFSETDVTLLRLASDRAALAIERARLYDREHEIAQQLQRSLLPPHLDPIPGLEMSARYLPGDADVGGDWYDAVALPGGRIAVCMGDVAGRGILAASTMGQLRSALRAHLLEGGGPARVLEQLNRFQLSLGPGTMATVLVLLLEPSTGQIRYASAGHPPPALSTQDNQIGHLAGGLSVPVGVFKDAIYEEASAILQPGSTLVLYTDGLVEQRREDYALGLNRLEAAISDPPADLDALCERILAVGLEGRQSEDDVTLLVLRLTGRLEDSLEIEMVAEAEPLASMRRLLRRWLAERGADGQEVQDITMACNEACQNAIEHAHRFVQTPFRVALSRERKRIMVSVHDRGRWADSAAGSEDRGRGLELMRGLMDSVDVDAGRYGTVVTLRRELRSSPAARARRRVGPPAS